MKMVEELARIFEESDIVELGHVFEVNMPAYRTQSKYYQVPWHRIKMNDGCNDNQIIMHEHNGTHVDSFGHFIDRDGYELIDKMAVQLFNGPCICIDATNLKSYGTLSKDAVLKHEEKYGTIEANSIVLIDTGWEKYWKLHPDDGAFVKGFPGISGEAAEYFVEKKVKLVGIDTMAMDADEAKGDPAHHALLGNRIPIVENLCNLQMLHDKKGYFIMLPLLIKNGTASPVRPVVLVENNLK